MRMPNVSAHLRCLGLLAVAACQSGSLRPELDADETPAGEVVSSADAGSDSGGDDDVVADTGILATEDDELEAEKPDIPYKDEEDSL